MTLQITIFNININGISIGKQICTAVMPEIIYNLPVLSEDRKNSLFHKVLHYRPLI